MLQVQQGICGDPVSSYRIEWDASEEFKSAAFSSLSLDRDDLLLEEQVQCPTFPFTIVKAVLVVISWPCSQCA